MFRTIGNTWQLMKLSGSVLNENRRLMVLPLLSLLAMALVVAVFLGIFAGAGTFGRLGDDSSLTATDYVIAAVLYLAGSFVTIYFNSALVAAAYAHLRGDEVSTGSAIAVANAHLPSIFGWACFATTVGLILSLIRSNDSLVGRIVAAVLGGIWAYMTFFVVPVLVIEGLSPIDAVKRSTSLLQQTWGRQLVSNFGFGIAHAIIAGVALLIGLVVFSLGLSTTATIVLIVVTAAPVLLAGVVVLMAAQGIFTSALYAYATTGSAPGVFNEELLSTAYRSKAK
jgi:hypothetical protein